MDETDVRHTGRERAARFIRRVSIAGNRAGRTIRALLPDIHVYAGIALVAYGAGQVPGWIGPVLAPLVVGLGLVWIVRFGAEPMRRR